jgi:hypothetical protein
MRVATLLAVLALSASALGQVNNTPNVPQPQQPPAVTEERAGGIPLPERPDQVLNKPTNDALDKFIEKVSLHEEPLVAVVDVLAKNAHVSISVNWKALEAAGVEHHTMVNLELSHIPARKVLDVLVSQISTPEGSLHYVVYNNQVVISTREDLVSAQYQQVLVYDVRSFFVDVELESPEALNDAQELVDLIKTVVAPDTWRDNGGTVGAIRVLNGQLIVNQTLENHDQLAGLLTELSKTPAHPTRAYDVQDLVNDDPATKVPALIAAVQASCGRDTWRGQGGKTSTIAFFDGKLYITTKPPVHDQIENLLKLMRQK